MKNSEVVIGGKYLARVSGLITVVEILDKGHPKGWVAKNFRTSREVYFKTGGRLWKAATKESMMNYLGFVPYEPVEFRDLAEVILDLTECDTPASIQHNTGLPIERCEEIIEIRNKLVDIPE